MTDAEKLLRMSAKDLRKAGMLWPQTLSNAELLEEFTACDRDSRPIGFQMLQDEIKTRKLELA